MGVCSVTTEWDGRYLMKNNYEYSKFSLITVLALIFPSFMHRQLLSMAMVNMASRKQSRVKILKTLMLTQK